MLAERRSRSSRRRWLAPSQMPRAQAEVYYSMTGRLLSLLLIGSIVVLAYVQGTVQRSGTTPDDLAQAAEATPWVATSVLSSVPAPDAAVTPQPLLASSSVSMLLTRYLQ